MFSSSKRLGSRSVYFCGCVLLVVSLEAIFCTDSVFAVGRRGRLRTNQNYVPVASSARILESTSSLSGTKKGSQIPEVTSSQTEAKTEAKPASTSSSPKVSEKETVPSANSTGLDLALHTDSTSTPSVAPAPEQLPEILCYWFQNWDEAHQASALLGRPMLIHFYMDYCGPCNKMEHTVFNQSQIQKLAGSHFVMVKLNGNQNPVLCSQFGISSFPADVILTVDGKVLSQSIGYQDVQKYGEFLTAAANQIQLPPMNNPVGPNWQSQAQLAQTPVNSKESADETLVALEVPALEAAVSQETTPDAKTNEVSEEQDLFTLSSSDDEVKMEEKTDSLPVAEELDLMALSTKQEIQRAPVPEKSMDHEASITESPVLAAQETGNSRLNLNPTSFSVDVKPLLEGFSPVALVDENKWVRGNETLTAEFENAQYCFVSEAEKEKFLQNPRFYALVSSGCDVVALTDNAQKVEGNRRFGVRFEDLNFVFSSAENLQKFRSNPEFYAAKVREFAKTNMKSESIR